MVLFWYNSARFPANCFGDCLPLVGILYTFLDWALNLRRGKNGRRLPGIKWKSSLETFWKIFRLVFERATSDKIENRVNRQMHRVRILALPNRGTVVLLKTHQVRTVSQILTDLPGDQFEEGETCRLPRNKRFENNVVELDCLGNHTSENEATESKSQSDSPLEAAFRYIMKFTGPCFALFV